MLHGFIVFMGIYLILYLLDDTIKTEEDVEKYLGVNTLAVIPLREGEKRNERGIRSVLRARKERLAVLRGKGGKA